MPTTPTTVERAYQLANSGTCAGIGDIKDRLRSERYTDAQAHLAGRSIRNALNKLCVQARAAAAQAHVAE